jgi:2-haloacid dehalogenase
MTDRWATFDCYGTLIDWHGGVRRELERIFGEDAGERLLKRYHEVEPAIQAAQPTMSYRQVMAETLGAIAAEEGRELTRQEQQALGESLPGWPVHPDVPPALEEARERGWRLVILSNTDRDFIEASMQAIGVPFELAIVAAEIGSYKPAPAHWHAFYEQTGADPARHVHVAESNFHDIGPARELDIPSVWINRRGIEGETRPDREQPDLSGVAETLDGLVPAR